MDIQNALKKHARNEHEGFQEVSPHEVKKGDVVVRIRSSIAEKVHLGVLIRVQEVENGKIAEGDLEWGEYKEGPNEEGEFDGGEAGSIHGGLIDLSQTPANTQVTQTLYRVEEKK